MSIHPYSTLSPERILDAIEAQGYRCDGRINALNSYENRVFQVGIEDAPPLIAKFYRPERWSLEQIREEHTFCAELIEAEWPVVAPLIGSDGQSCYEDNGFIFSLFTRFGGRAPEPSNLDTIELLGRSLIDPPSICGLMVRKVEHFCSPTMPYPVPWSMLTTP